MAIRSTETDRSGCQPSSRYRGREKRRVGRLIALVAPTILVVGACTKPGVNVEGEKRVWHPLTLTVRGPKATQTDESPNPFLDYRLDAMFTGPSGQTYTVPGYFDGDGEGSGTGSVWRVRFSPDEAGRWNYAIAFRTGPNVAVSLAPDEGERTAPDGFTDDFLIAPRDEDAPGFLRWGRLEYAGEHYLKFRDGPHWIRGGTDSPENFLGYQGFDNTPPSHHYRDHVNDWRPGDPDWGRGRGKGIIGALNYLASHHVNSVYILTMNVGGDGQDVWPWAGTPDPAGSPQNDNLHFDVEKLGQWEVVFDHAERLGIFLHLVLNEAEAANKKELDDGELGTERKLYYRELIARFGHHLALEWNICEEHNLDLSWEPERIRSFARYIDAVDPYDHPITVHSSGDPTEELRFTFGDPLFSLTSIQINHRRIDSLTEAFRTATAESGRPLPVSMDEFTIDAGQVSWIPIDDPVRHRREKLWPTYFSGGMIEFILEDMLETESFKTEERERLWDYTWYARRFMEEHLPFWEMEPADELVSGEATILVPQGDGRTFQLGAQVFAKPGEVYAIYLPDAHPSGVLDLRSVSGTYVIRWYDPQMGRFEGTSQEIRGGGLIPLGTPPANIDEDWVVLVREKQ